VQADEEEDDITRAAGNNWQCDILNISGCDGVLVQERVAKRACRWSQECIM
jgi:hypothetical protein